MKKTIISALICAALILSLAGCGDSNEPASTPKPSSSSSSSTPASSSAPESSSEPESSAPEQSSAVEVKVEFPAAVMSAQRLAIETMENTIWTLAGGYSAGAELDDAGLQTVLEAYGGSLKLSFTADKASLDSGSGDHTEFDYALSDDKSTLTLLGENADMAGIFIEQNEMAILAAKNLDGSDMVLYFAAPEG